MTNETNQAQWVESDGVSNLPTVKGCYEFRATDPCWEEKWGWIAYFDGERFFPCASCYDKDQAMRFSEREHTLNEFGKFVNAWRDYQGLMSKPAKVVGSEHVHQSGRGLTQAITYFDPSPYLREDGPVQPSDEPGIQRAAYAAKYEAKQTGPTIIHGVTVDPVVFAAFLDSQRPKPAPNTTPRGIMTVWNEAADHRLGQWNQGAME